MGVTTSEDKDMRRHRSLAEYTAAELDVLESGARRALSRLQERYRLESSPFVQTLDAIAALRAPRLFYADLAASGLAVTSMGVDGKMERIAPEDFFKEPDEDAAP